VGVELEHWWHQEQPLDWEPALKESWESREMVTKSAAFLPM
jgi:hypothetical protein